MFQLKASHIYEARYKKKASNVFERVCVCVRAYVHMHVKGDEWECLHKYKADAYRF
jgi:hypothetical protein